MRRLLFIAPALAALVLSACGSSASDSTGTQAGASPAAPDGQRGFPSDEVRSCLEKQGIDLPDRPQGGGGYGPPGGGGFGGQMPGADRQGMQDALKACGVQMPDRSARPAMDSADYRKRVNAYVACVRENGFDLPDPDFSGDGPIFDPDQVDQADKAFQAASAKCQDELRPQASSSTTS